MPEAGDSRKRINYWGPYISKVMPKLTRFCKSRYLVVSDDVMMPKPRPMLAIMMIRKGINNSHKVGRNEAPESRK